MAYGLNSLKHAAQNIGGAIGMGYKAGIGQFSEIGKMLPNHIGSVGGLATLGGAAVAGAGVGGWYGSVSNSGSSIGEGAAAGAAIGVAALPAVGLAASLGYHVANNLEKIGSAAINSTVSLARGVGIAGVDVAASLDSTNRLMNPVGTYANKVGKMFDKLVTHTPGKEVWNAEKGIMESKGGGLKLSGWGKAAVGIGAVAAGAYGAKEALETSHMGTMDGYVTTNTPRVPSYKDDGGASGDLVFALNANRRG
jgi:hypothetical protein